MTSTSVEYIKFAKTNNKKIIPVKSNSRLQYYLPDKSTFQKVGNAVARSFVAHPKDKEDIPFFGEDRENISAKRDDDEMYMKEEGENQRKNRTESKEEELKKQTKYDTNPDKVDTISVEGNNYFKLMMMTKMYSFQW